jgi:hypothetical protein
MENHVFDSFLEHCQEFPQASTGLEIFNYTVCDAAFTVSPPYRCSSPGSNILYHNLGPSVQLM